MGQRRNTNERKKAQKSKVNKYAKGSLDKSEVEDASLDETLKETGKLTRRKSKRGKLR